MRIEFDKLQKIGETFGEDFSVNQVIGNTGTVYLRFGYWRKVNIVKLSEILGVSIFVNEYADYDEDCGWNYSYELSGRF